MRELRIWFTPPTPPLKVGLIMMIALFYSFSAFCQVGNDKIIYGNGKKFYSHIVIKGETIYGLAKDYNVTIRDLILENPHANDGISPGDTLNIPIMTNMAKTKKDTSVIAGSTPSQGKFIFHTVERKETMYSLSKRYKISIAIIDSLNPDVRQNGLKKGQVIRLPITTETESNETVAYRKLLSEPPRHDSVSTAHPADTGLRNRYKVALLFPFSSPDLDSIPVNRLREGNVLVPMASQISSDFYHGFQFALDSLSHTGLKVDLYIYNVSYGNDSSKSKFDSLLKRPELATMNLIIGPPNSVFFHKIARFSITKHIPVVSPLSAEGVDLKDMPTASKVTPSSVTEMEQMADYIALYYKHANIITVNYKEDTLKLYYKPFCNRLKLAMTAFSNHDSVRELEYYGNLDKLSGKINRGEVNIIVFPYLNTPRVANFVNQLANSFVAKRDSVILFGMHGWVKNDVLDIANLDTLNFHFLSNHFINYNDTIVKKFVLKYRKQYYGDPDYYACQGFDIGWFYLCLLHKYGTAMQEHLGDLKYKGVHTSFDFFRPAPLSGYENKAVYMLEYRNYVELKDPF